MVGNNKDTTNAYVTSVPTTRDARRDGTNHRYFEIKRL